MSRAVARPAAVCQRLGTVQEIVGLLWLTAAATPRLIQAGISAPVVLAGLQQCTKTALLGRYRNPTRGEA